MNKSTLYNSQYNIRQWSESHSPLRMSFHPDDPDRTGFGISFITSPNGTRGGRIIPGESDPSIASMIVSFRTSWLDALKLLLRGNDVGIAPVFDADGQVMMS